MPLENLPLLRPDLTPTEKVLGVLSTAVMRECWQHCVDNRCRPFTVRFIYELLRQHRQIAYTTVMTTMTRLEDNGLLRCVDKKGLAKLYLPAVTEHELLAAVNEALAC